MVWRYLRPIISWEARCQATTILRIGVSITTTMFPTPERRWYVEEWFFLHRKRSPYPTPKCRSHPRQKIKLPMPVTKFHSRESRGERGCRRRTRSQGHAFIFLLERRSRGNRYMEDQCRPHIRRLFCGNRAEGEERLDHVGEKGGEQQCVAQIDGNMAGGHYARYPENSIWPCHWNPVFDAGGSEQYDDSMGRWPLRIPGRCMEDREWEDSDPQISYATRLLRERGTPSPRLQLSVLVTPDGAPVPPCLRIAFLD